MKNMKRNIYAGREKCYKRELDNLEKETFEVETTKIILKWHDVKFAENVGDIRVAKVNSQLRWLRNHSDKPLTELQKDDIIRLLARFKDTPIFFLSDYYNDNYSSGMGDIFACVSLAHKELKARLKDLDLSKECPKGDEDKNAQLFARIFLLMEILKINPGVSPVGKCYTSKVSNQFRTIFHRAFQ